MNNSHSKTRWLIVIGLSSAILSGCVALEESQIPAAEEVEEQISLKEHQRQIESMQKEIERLEQAVAEKDALIKQKRIREQDQAQIIQATSKEIASTQIKLHRLATKPSSASLISEAEVAIAYLNQQPASASDEELHKQAKRLLNAAVTNYTRQDYATATYYASQAIEFTNMIADKERDLPSRATIRFNTPIMLRTNTDTNLRREPGRHTLIIDVLKQGTVLTANAYQGNWLMVQTDENRQGWVFNALIETVVGEKQ